MWAAAIPAIAGIAGDLISQSGQQSTNAAMTANMMQNEQWQEAMSNTAMQRRVNDLRNAGLNPMLATGTTGAQVGSVGQPSLGNPGQGFQNMGQVGASAVQAANVQAQTENIQADTKLKTQQFTPDIITADANGEPNWQATSGGGTLGTYTAQRMYYEAQGAKASWDKTLADVKNVDADTLYKKTMNEWQGKNLDVLKDTARSLVARAAAEAGLSEANMQDAQAQAKIMSSSYGPAIKALQAIGGTSIIPGLIGAGVAALGRQGSAAAQAAAQSHVTDTQSFGPTGKRIGSTTTTRQPMNR